MELKKLGTFDTDIVEANPIVFQGKLWMMEYIRDGSKTNGRYHSPAVNNSYFRFRDMEDMTTFSAPFGLGLHMGNAFVRDGKIIVTAVENWGAPRFYLMTSEDMVHWTEPKVFLEGEGWEGYNTSLCWADDRYVVVFELGAPRELVKEPFTMFFAESKDLVNWSLVPGASGYRDVYTGGPMIRYFDGWFYWTYLDGSYEHGFMTHIARSRDLKKWEHSYKNPVIRYDEDDRKVYPKVQLTADQQERIAKAEDINASDLDICDWQGKCCILYSWGNQRGKEFLALAEADCTEKEFCESFFP